MNEKDNNTMDSKTVAVIGLGAMGLPIAQRLTESYSVRGYDISEKRKFLATGVGIMCFDSATEATTTADVTLLVVRDAAQLNDVLFGDSGIVDAVEAGSPIVLMSTIGVEAVRDVAYSLDQRGIALVDAPLSGGPARALGGDLLIVVGGSESARSAVGPVLEALASTLRVIGEKPGDGQAFKTVNQLLCGVHIAAAAEALVLARALGLDDRATLETLTTGAAASFMLGDRGPRMLKGYEDTEVFSRLDIFVKDMGIVNRSARLSTVPTPIAAAAEQLYLLGMQQGFAARDDSSVIDILGSRE